MEPLLFLMLLLLLRQPHRVALFFFIVRSFFHMAIKKRRKVAQAYFAQMQKLRITQIKPYQYCTELLRFEMKSPRSLLKGYLQVNLDWYFISLGADNH